MSGFDADVVVLGLGAVGSATLHALASRGVRAIGVERYGRAHEWGSHHGHTRVFRHAYFEHPDYVPMLLDSTARVDRLQEAVGEALQERCGVLLVGEPGSVVVGQSAASAARFGVPVEWLDPAGLARRFPQFAAGPETLGLFEPGGGFLRPEAIMRAQLKRAEALGAHVRTNTPVLGWDEDEHGVTVRVDGGDLRAAGLVVAAGAWTTALVPSLAPLLWVSREMQGWLQPLQPALAQPDRLPCWLVERVGQRVLYGIPVDPLHPGPPIAKVAVHGGGSTVDVADVDRVVSASEVAALQQAAGETLPGLPGSVVGAKVCLYTNTPDDDFIVDRVPGSRRAWVAAGMSGHGFKLAPALGAALADLVTDGRTDQPVGFLGLSRFR